MSSTSFSSWTSAPLRRWRQMSRRRRFRLAGVLALLVLGGWLAWIWWDPWPARMVLRGADEPLPLAFSPADGKILASARGNSITLWGLDTGRQKSPWKLTPNRSVFHGAYAPDGRTFVAAWLVPGSGTPISLDLIDVESGETRTTVATPGGSWSGIAFLPDGRSARMTGDDGRSVRVVDFDLMTGLSTSSRPLAAPTKVVRTVISPDGRYLASVPIVPPSSTQTRDWSAVVWDVDRDREALFVRTAPGTPHVWDVAFAPDGTTLAVGRTDGAVELWDIPSRRLLKTMRGHSEGFGFSLLKFAPDGSTLASTGRFTGSRLSPGRLPQEFGRLLKGRVHDHPAELVVFDPATGRVLGRALDEARPIVSPDGRTLATFSIEGTIKIRDLPGRSGN